MVFVRYFINTAKFLGKDKKLGARCLHRGMLGTPSLYYPCLPLFSSAATSKLLGRRKEKKPSSFPAFAATSQKPGGSLSLGWDSHPLNFSSFKALYFNTRV